eukprot:TRINITY_DN991_c0_g1_i1.p1 TRINITY_DN991_c0_g1~~TRINITY_DN991_c0_g1_i1.p1  ORF type:complete len:321 (+),score=42.98 TRINITY_DN991_c0_g1_i1:86-964(+)
MAPAVTERPKRTLPFLLSGVPSAIAAMCTHPLDFFKVRLQTQRSGAMWGTVRTIAKQEGPFTFYNGLSASLLRQLTYSTTRFGVYENLAPWTSQKYFQGEDLPLYAKILVSGFAGVLGGIVGTPADVINIKMQAHRGKVKLYRHAVHGITTVAKEDGVMSLWRGVTPNINRAVLMTASQIATYGHVKEALMRMGFRNDLQGEFWSSVWTHFVASFIAGFVATSICSPVDNLKTRLMNAPPGTYTGMIDCTRKVIQREGSRGFFKGFIPSWIRLAPQTVITMLTLEQLKYVFE